MSSGVTRREAVRRIGTAGAAIALGPSTSLGAGGRVIRGRQNDIVIGGRPVEIVVTSISDLTARITVLPIEGGKSLSIPDDGGVAQPNAGTPAGSGRAPDTFKPIRAGSLSVRWAQGAIHVESTSGRPVQRLGFDAQAPDMTFLLPRGPLLGLGQGGPQFDRKGQTFATRSGQGGYQLATHGARVPIQWLVGTDGWAMFIHQPYGAFDLTGEQGRFTPAAPGAPFDVFVVAASEPAAIMREYARITGLAAMPPLWTFG